MRAVIQRVLSAEVSIGGKVFNSIGRGLLVYVGIDGVDKAEDAAYLARKITGMRIFDDEKGLMNNAINDVKGHVLVISQFTLHAKTKKGNRPSFIRAAPPDVAVPLYEDFIELLHGQITGKVKAGKFGANMLISSINDGPVTVLLDTQNKE